MQTLAATERRTEMTDSFICGNGIAMVFDSIPIF